jgi:dynein heavy chain
MGELYG